MFWTFQFSDTNYFIWREQPNSWPITFLNIIQENFPLCLIGFHSPLGGWESWSCFQTCIPVLGPVRVTNNVWRSAQFFYKIDLLTYHRFESWVFLSENSCYLVNLFSFAKKSHILVIICCYYLPQWWVEFELTWICLQLSFLIKIHLQKSTKFFSKFILSTFYKLSCIY